MKRTAFGVCVAWIFVFSQLAWATPPSVAVLEMEGEGISPVVSQAAMDQARASLIEALGDRANVLTPENQTNLFRENGLKDKRCSADSCDVEIFQTLQVDFGISCRVNRVGSKYFGAMTLYQTSSGKALAARKIQANNEPELVMSVGHAATLLLTHFPGYAKHVRPRLKERSLGDNGASALPGTASADVIVQLQSEPVGAMVLLGGEPLCPQTPCAKRLSQGVHEIRFALPDHKAELRLIEVVPEMKPVFVALRPTYATLRFAPEDAQASIEVDGTHISNKEIERGLRLASGIHEVWIVDPCFKRNGQRIVLEEGEVRRVELNPVPRISALTLSVQDRAGNDLDVPVLLKGRRLGNTVDTISIPICTKEVEVEVSGTRVPVRLPQLEPEQRVRVEVLMAGESDPESLRWGELDRETHVGTKLVWVRLPGGKFLWGCEPQDGFCEEDELPGEIRHVSPFWLLQTEVTVAAYKACLHAGACHKRSCTQADDQPANCLDFAQAIAFCHWLGGRLPTPVEWEYAAKSGTSRTYPWGDEPPTAQVAAYRTSGAARLPAVGSHPQGHTPFGLWDMAGSVAEWTQESDSAVQQLRGGAWTTRSEILLRNSYRQTEVVGFRSPATGVRCAK